MFEQPTKPNFSTERFNREIEQKMSDLQIDEVFASLRRFYAVTEDSGLRVEMDEFASVPGFNVSEDKRAIREKQGAPGYLRVGTAIGKFVENLLAHETDKMHLFGKDTWTMLGSEYDDLFHGVDFVVEVNGEKGVARFSIDLATGNHAGKDAVTSKHLAHGDLGRVKYFRSGYDEKVVGLPNAPHIVLPIDPEQVYDFLGKAKRFVDISGRASGKDVVKDPENYKKQVRVFLKEVRKSFDKELRKEVFELLSDMIRGKILGTEYLALIEKNVSYEEIFEKIKDIKTENEKQERFLRSLRTLLETGMILASNIS